MRMSKSQAEQIRRDLQRSPAEFGYSQLQWTGNCLSRYLGEKYGLGYGTRSCRRLIQRSKRLIRSGSFPLAEAKPEPVSAEANVWCGFSDDFRHEKTLQRLRQLSTANLPPNAFAATLFEQLTSATNSGDAAQMICFGHTTDNRVIMRDRESFEWAIAHPAEYERANSDDPKITGMLIPSGKLGYATAPVLAPGQFIGQRFHESPSYHELFKVNQIYSGVMNVVRSDGKLIGLAPVWKSRREKPFTQKDLQFFHRALPSIAHGMYMSQAFLHRAPISGETDPVSTNIGVVTADLSGRILAINSVARAFFLQPSLFDGCALDAFAATNLRAGLKYVSGVVRRTFGNEGIDNGSLAVPAIRVWWHGTGCILLLRAVVSQRISGSPLVTILIEERELRSTKQRRLAIKYGMSPRESEIYHLAKAGMARKQIAQDLGLSLNTVKTYLKQVAAKGLTVSAES